MRLNYYLRVQSSIPPGLMFGACAIAWLGVSFILLISIAIRGSQFGSTEETLALMMVVSIYIWVPLVVSPILLVLLIFKRRLRYSLLVPALLAALLSPVAVAEALCISEEAFVMDVYGVSPAHDLGPIKAIASERYFIYTRGVGWEVHD